MARDLDEFKKQLGDTVRTGEAMAQQGLAEPLPVFDPVTEAQVRSINFMFSKIFGSGHGG